MQLPNNCEESEWQTMDKDKDIEILTELYRVYCCAGVNEVSRLRVPVRDADISGFPAAGL